MGRETRSDDDGNLRSALKKLESVLVLESFLCTR